jgi:type II secretion system protein C
MIKGIAIRRTFNLIEAILGIVLIVLLGYAIHSFTKPPAKTSSSQSPEDESIFAIVAESDDYSMIQKNGLFGTAATLKTVGPAKPPVDIPPPTGEEVPTSLPLTLKGTVVSAPPLASATIEVREKGSFTDTFYLDQEIMDGVILKEVRKKEVVLQNNRSNRPEVLKLTYLMSSATGVSGRPASTIQRSRPSNRAPQTASRVQSIPLNRKQITDQLDADYEKYASTVDVKVVEEDGKVKGITTDNIEDIPSAKSFGFKNGDILVSVNNEKVDSVDKITEIANKYQNATNLTIGILRDNKPETFRYTLR